MQSSEAGGFFWACRRPLFLQTASRSCAGAFTKQFLCEMRKRRQGHCLSMSVRKFIRATVLILCGGLAGYRMHRPENSDLFLAPEKIPQLEYFTGPESFSKIENGKNDLEALCRRARLEAQTKFVIHAEKGSQASAQEEMISDLGQVMNEFKGSVQEVEIAQDLLLVLKRAQRFEQWTELYLKLLYQYPMHPVLIGLAEDALVIGKAAGRPAEILAGLEHLNAIPYEFEGKARIALILESAGPQKTLTRLEMRGHSNQPRS